jgi:hypothetical protein
MLFVLQHGKKTGWINGHGPPPPNTIGEIFAADLSEPISAPVTADSTAYTADNTTWPTADGGILEGATDFIDAAVEIIAIAAEAASALDTLDATSIANVISDEPADAADVLDAIVIVADAAILLEVADAADVLDAEIIAAEIPISGGGYYRPPRPFPVEGRGFGLLPELRGEAHGVIIPIGAADGELPGVIGEAAGTVGAAGRGATQFIVHAAAIGEHGQAGAATAVLKGLSIESAGVIGTRGSGLGILELKGAAIGRYDDDEAAVMTFLLAA